MTMRFFFALLLAGLAQRLAAQPQHSYWFFGGGAGLHFSDGGVKTLQGSKLSAEEGSAAIADGQGQLIFYTDGREAWNRHHERMPYGFGLRGHKSSTQSALIIPRPQRPGRYYVFTVDENGGENPPNEGLYYSEVDRAMDDSLGDFRMGKKNKQLLETCTEKLTAVQHANRRDIWVLAHPWNSKNYHAYLVTPEGVRSDPVVSSTPVPHSDQELSAEKKAGFLGKLKDRIGPQAILNTTNAIGYLKASKDGRWLASAIRDRGVELLQFDKENGRIRFVGFLPAFYDNVYGVAFSPKGSKLYVTNVQKDFRLMQYDLNQTSFSGIKASGTLIDSSQGSAGALQLGPNGKIYVARYARSWLGVVAQPEAQGLACDYQRQGVYLGPHMCKLGLPNLPHVFKCRSIPLNLGPDTTLCPGQILKLDASTMRTKSYLWSNGDTTAQTEITDGGSYWVKARGKKCTATDTIRVRFSSGCNSPLNIPTLVTPNGDGKDDRFEVGGLEPGQYSLTITNEAGEVLHRCEQYRNLWEPSGLPNGRYYYHLKSNEGPTEYRGWVQVRR